MPSGAAPLERSPFFSQIHLTTEADVQLPIKDPAEKKLIRFEFGTEIESGVTIASVDVSIATVAGEDASPGAVLDGVPIIDNVNLQVLQTADDGLDACDYEIRVLATDSNGLRHLVVGRLPVRTIH